jgi:DNA mismatch repair ATPase MutS
MPVIVQTINSIQLTQSVEDIYELASHYAKEHGLPELRVAFSAGRGYYLTLPATGIGSLPSVFISSNVVKKAIQCTTEEIASLRYVGSF